MMLRNFLKLGALGLSVFLLSFTLFQLYSFKYSGPTNSNLVNILRNKDVNYNYELARSFYNSEDYKSAKLYYTKSLISNPLYTKSMVDLSEINLESDNYDYVEILLERAYELTPYSFKLLWRMSILSLWIDNNELALNILKRISKVDNYKVFDIAWRVINNNDLIMSNMVNNNNIINYLEFLIRKNKVEESFVVWNIIKENGFNDYELSGKYMNFLIKSNKITEAVKIWDDRHGEININSPVSNGGFESKPINNGFGWEIKKIDDVFIGYDWEEKKDGKYSLNIIFNGKDNINFRNISKIVPVKPNSIYNFFSYIKTDEITTQNGIFWEISCFPNYRLFNSETMSYKGTNNWTKVEKELPIPSECRAVKIILRRLKSNKLDKNISGKVWLDEVKLEKIN